MKVLFIGYSDFNGGAARATYWLAQGLRSKGIDVEFLVEQKVTDNYWIKTYHKNLFERVMFKIENLILKYIKSKNSSHWSLNFSWNSDLINQVEQFNPDVINFHWIGNSTIPLKLLNKFKKPIIWSLYDMWPFTAGCHYDNFCGKFETGCNNCPQLNFKVDLSAKIFNLKNRAFKNSRIRFVSPSIWLKDIAYSSKIIIDNNLEVDVIPHGTDLKVYNNLEKSLCRNILNLSDHNRYLLFGSMSGINDQRKGFQYLVPALKILSEMGIYSDVKILIFGENEPEVGVDLGFDIQYLGRIADDITLKIIYSASDLLITPSMQEAFGMTASEAMACGTPVVAFNIAGAKDVIDHKINGYLVESFDINDLVRGIEWGINNLGFDVSNAARNKCIDKFSLENISERYIQLYSNQISSNL